MAKNTSIKQIQKQKRRILGRISRSLNFCDRFVVLMIATAILLDMFFPQVVMAKAGEPVGCQASPRIYCLENINLYTEPLEPSSDKLTRVFYTTVTAYSSTFDQTDSTPFITANGTMVGEGVAAANFLPFKTKFKIPDMFGDRIFTVEDRMHRRFSDRIDIWMPSRTAAKKFGIKKLRIEVLDREVTMK